MNKLEILLFIAFLEVSQLLWKYMFVEYVRFDDVLSQRFTHGGIDLSPFSNHSPDFYIVK